MDTFSIQRAHSIQQYHQKKMVNKRGKAAAKKDEEPAPEEKKVATRGKKALKADAKQDAGTKTDDAPKPEPRTSGRAKKDVDPAPEPVKPATKGKKGAKAEKKDDEEPPVQKKVKSDDEPQLKQKAKEEPPVVLKKTIVKGRAPVDEYVYHSELYHVLEDAGVVFDSMMNQTNIVGGSNNNKFYVVQVLETDADPKQYYSYNRWGRVGVQGQIAMKGPWDKFQAIHDFNHKVREKSVKGDYVVVERDFAPVQDLDELKKREDDAFGKSKLELQVKELIKLIFDLKMMNKQMMEIGYDPKKMPLGKLAKSTIEKGFRVLEELSQAIKRKAAQSDYERLTSEFYSQIPHDFGFSQAPIIKTEVDVKKKIEMLESIQQIQVPISLNYKVATRMLDEDKTDSNANVIDSHYGKLECNIKWVPPGHQTYKLLEQYVKNTHAKTHSNYSLDIMEIFELDKELDHRRFKGDMGNRMLLWHGSRITNFVGILSQGLRIAPPEAPVTGYMFGKGVYFADMVSKSANYCGTSRESNVGMLLLCDVALGNMNDKFYADYNASNLPPGKHSTRGVGKTAPSEKSYVEKDGYKIPLGVGEPSNVQNTALLYNEYIVYDISQIQFKYLIKLKYNYM